LRILKDYCCLVGVINGRLNRCFFGGDPCFSNGAASIGSTHCKGMRLPLLAAAPFFKCVDLQSRLEKTAELRHCKTNIRQMKW